ncbi:proteasome assembly chaperone family protein [Ruania halotolerans]|uniref:proteasome assembly chaperone family protein n=1 Tax=Ruania halotolerans TaxID=2897773 RepID=UPI001E3CA9EC|nr:PAC2 family protein [Ruania halotolerans]UFU05139.1 PAC2 family protein [Ruania halotolerans]
MNHPRDLYRIVDDAPELHDGEAPVLVHALSGSIDAGHAGSLLARHLREKLPSRRLLEFDLDTLLDYRSRRPVMTFAEGTWVEYDKPELVVDLVRDDDGVPLLLMHGHEPDLQWEKFTRAVQTVIEDYGVELTIGVHGIPMGVPHTRPLTVTAHATRAELIESYPNYFSRVQVPGSAAALLELRLGQEGRDAMGFAVNVPHYLAQTEYPQAAAELVRQITKVSGMSLPVGDLEASGTQVRSEVDRQVAESEEVSAVVQALERQYDSFLEASGTDGAESIGQGQVLDELPSADELAAQFEAFLAGREDGPTTG